MEQRKPEQEQAEEEGLHLAALCEIGGHRMGLRGNDIDPNDIVAGIFGNLVPLSASSAAPLAI